MDASINGCFSSPHQPGSTIAKSDAIIAESIEKSFKCASINGCFSPALAKATLSFGFGVEGLGFRSPAQASWQRRHSVLDSGFRV